MGQNKQQLAKLLHFIKAVYDNPENWEFAKGLRKIVERDIVKDEPHILNIEKYLSLDFNIDEIGNTDYSFIKEDYTKEKLNADFREMLRYRFGTRGHKVDFPEFCRFAVLQIEMLVNYYYDKRYSADITLIKQAIFANNPPNTQFYAKATQATQLSEIALKNKIYALRNEFGWNTTDISDYLYAIDVRNRQSHRSLTVYTDRIKEMEESFKQKGVMYENGYIDYKKIKGVINQADLNEYNFEKWYDNMPFEKIKSSMTRLAEAIKSSLFPS